MFDSNSIIVGLEVGTSKICAVVGEQTGEGTLNIVGLGQARSTGVRKGEIVDGRAAEENIRAVKRARRAFGIVASGTGASLLEWPPPAWNAGE